jgi:predicted neuraminidase
MGFMSTTRQRCAWIALALALHMAPAMRDGWHSGGAPRVEFAVRKAVPPGPAAEPPICREEFVLPQGTTAFAHVSSLCELDDGRLAAVWCGGSREGARDVAVWLATRGPLTNDPWSSPRPVVTRASAAQETFRFVRKVGNALLVAGQDGRLTLVYVSVGVGGWSGSSLNIKQSVDGGESWSPSQRLGLSPFFNVSELVKNNAQPLTDGGWAVPVYHEAFGKFPEVLWLHQVPGRVEAVKSRPFGGRTAFQPALVALDSQRALMLCRAAGSAPEIHITRTSDAGRHWTVPRPGGLPNPNSGLGAVRLSDGRLLLAFNDSNAGRENLRLALSNDEGVTWRRAGTLVEEPGEEFSYPFLLQTSDGLVHVTYTWKRRNIRHVTFNLAWLDSQVAGKTP